MFKLRKISHKALLVFALVLGLGVLASGCAEEEAGEFQEDVELPIVEWPGVTQKTHVIQEVLETMGYNTNIETYSLELILQGLKEGDLDAFTGSWFQTWGTPLEEALEEGSVVHVSTQLEETNYGPAVPTYLYEEEGITCLSDLHEYSEEFNYQYHGLEPGNDGNQIMIEAFENDTYNLGEWEIVESNTAAMITEAEQRIEEGEWIVFSGWEPHWMNVILDMKYIDDPEGIWGEDERVGTVARAGLEEDDQNLYLFFEQFDIDSEIQNEWIYEYSYEERDPEAVAEEWIGENLDLVLEWVEGLQTTEGEDAQEALREAYE